MNSDTLIINQFFKEHPKDAAKALEELEPLQLAGFFNASALEVSLGIIPRMDPHLMVEVYKEMDRKITIRLFESLELHHAVLSIRIMPEEFADSILSELTEGKSNEVKKLVQYLDHSVGSHMDPSVLTLVENQKVEDALGIIKKFKRKVQSQLFVLSRERKLSGFLLVSDLITAGSDSEIKSIMSTKITALSPETPIQAILSHPEWANYYALPVVDNHSIFLGAIKLESIRSIQVKSSFKGEESGQATVNALGELYRIGLTGLLRTAAEMKTLSEE